MKLYAGPLSHFSRKVRILMDSYGLPYEVIDIGNVAEGPMEKFGNNPLARIPVLVDGETWIIDSDRISEYIVRKVDPSDRYRVFTEQVSEQNVRSVLNGIMADEVTVIIARRTKLPTDQYVFFDDALEAIRNGLAWLEDQADIFDPESPKYTEFHLMCAWEHLAYFDFVPLHYQKLKKVIERLSQYPVIAQTAPSVLKPRKPKPPAPS